MLPAVRLAEIGTRVLGTPAVAAAARRVTRRDLRVLAYHGVPSPHPFTAQVEHLVREYQCVDGAQVTGALSGSRSLPENAVWITFDDGRPDVIENALPVLSRFGVSATLFVVAGVVDSDIPFWWDVVERGMTAGVVEDGAALSRLKRVPDEQRRLEVGGIIEQLAENGGPFRVHQLRHADLKLWLSHGMEIGNHSWDHPCLDMCQRDAQASQIRRAHERLTSLTGDRIRLFAYPNGNFSQAVDDELQALDYSIGLLFDHKLARLEGPPLAMSRLRVDSQADLSRFRAIVSGGHSTVFAAQRRAASLIGRSTGSS
jgi:peptidoglycan/xylan/chitin deacetylase (PgdA/CDA1 family)